MRIGVCGNFNGLEEAAAAGADYIECKVTELMKLTDGEFRAAAEKNSASSVKCEVLSILFPGAQIPLTGENVNYSEIEKYLRGAFKRIRNFISPEIIVLGSGGARKYPEGFERKRAKEQFIEVGKIAAGAAEDFGFTIALEPLNRGECNLINSLADGTEIIKAVNRANFKLLADIYHMLVENEPAEAILTCGEILIHTHVASKQGRLYPQEKDRAELAPYFDALKKIGYGGRMSIEAGKSGTLKESIHVVKK